MQRIAVKKYATFMKAIFSYLLYLILTDNSFIVWLTQMVVVQKLRHLTLVVISRRAIK